MIKHFYHLYADGKWNLPVAEHISALSGIDDYMVDFNVLAIGTRDRCIEAQTYLSHRLPKSVARFEFRDRREGWEQETLAWLKSDADTSYNQDDPYLYCHTKGAYSMASNSADWRWSMTRHVIGRWKECLDWLKLVDVVGCHWLTPEQYEHVNDSFFGGNYWWATADYIRKLPPQTYNDRWDAERWIGQSSPTTHDLCPGWPNY